MWRHTEAVLTYESASQAYRLGERQADIKRGHIVHLTPVRLLSRSAAESKSNPKLRYEQKC